MKLSLAPPSQKNASTGRGNSPLLLRPILNNQFTARREGARKVCRALRDTNARHGQTQTDRWRDRSERRPHIFQNRTHTQTNPYTDNHATY